MLAQSCISAVARETGNPQWGQPRPLTLVYPSDGPPPSPPQATQHIGATAPTEPATLRARVDAHRAAILACAPGTVVAQRVDPPPGATGSLVHVLEAP